MKQHDLFGVVPGTVEDDLVYVVSIRLLRYGLVLGVNDQACDVVLFDNDVGCYRGVFHAGFDGVKQDRLRTGRRGGIRWRRQALCLKGMIKQLACFDTSPILQN